MIIEVVIFLVTSFVLYLLFSYKRVHYYLDKHDIKYLPGVPVYGNMLGSSFQKTHFVDDLGAVYKAFPDERYVALIEFTKPVIIIRDPELIKLLTVKDFDHFVNHKEYFSEDVDTLFGGSVFNMKDEKWRDMRTTLSPAFTGSKMRLMMPFMTEICDNIMEFLKENKTDEVDLLDMSRRYANDVIASAAFGLKINSLKDKDNEFYKIGQSLFKFTLLQKINFIFYALFPAIVQKLEISLFPKSTKEFFTNVVTSTMKYRKQNNVERPDMIHLLMEAYKGTLSDSCSTTEKDNIGFATVQEELKGSGNVRKWTLDELAGQVFIFFVAGFDTSSTSLTMAIHELALNPDVEENLYQEVRGFKEKRGILTYDNINELEYLDCVLNESMRKWSASTFMDRTCTKSYDLPPPREGGKPYRINKGDLVYNMVNCIQMDPKYYTNPDKFDPERFSNENKHNIKPFTFSPFGAGPRNCIGSRFAILELKIFLYHLILNFKIMKSPKTVNPIELDPKVFTINCKGGSFAKFVKRT